MRHEWESKYLAIMIFCCRKLKKSKKANFMVIGRDLEVDLLARLDWAGIDRGLIPKSIRDVSKL